jgi:sec-independent protein translocase protein TatA
MFGLGYQELMIILLIVALLFGAQKIPELARSIGKAKGEFRKGEQESDVVKTEKAPDEKKSA